MAARQIEHRHLPVGHRRRRASSVDRRASRRRCIGFVGFAEPSRHTTSRRCRYITLAPCRCLAAKKRRDAMRRFGEPVHRALCRRRSAFCMRAILPARSRLPAICRARTRPRAQRARNRTEGRCAWPVARRLARRRDAASVRCELQLRRRRCAASRQRRARRRRLRRGRPNSAQRGHDAKMRFEPLRVSSASSRPSA